MQLTQHSCDKTLMTLKVMNVKVLAHFSLQHIGSLEHLGIKFLTMSSELEYVSVSRFDFPLPQGPSCIWIWHSLDVIWGVHV